MRPVSQSDVLPYERCPALWHATRVRGLDAGNRAARIGTACHVACEAATRAVLGEDGRALYLVARDAVTVHADAVDLPPDEMHEALDVMDSATAEGSAISFYVPQGWTAEAEVDLTLNEAFFPAPEPRKPLEAPVAYRGRLDRLQWNAETGELEVWDWKTSEDWLAGADVLLDVQARWYAMLALAWFPAAHTVTFKRVMLRLGYTATAKFVRGERWHGQIMDRARRLRAATNALLRPDGIIFPMTERPGSWCRHCPVAAECGTREAAEARTDPDANVPREMLARELGVLKSAVARIDERLRADVAANGPIPLGDGSALGFFPKRAMVLRPDVDAVAELRRMGMGLEQEREWFVPSERAMPGIVKAALRELEPNRGMREAAEAKLLAPATGFQFEVKEVEDA